MRPVLKSEAPAKWYLEDGSGRALALLQRILRYGEAGRTAWAYLGHEPDERSAFFKLHPLSLRHETSCEWVAAEPLVPTDR